MKWSLETVCNRGVTGVGQILKNDPLFDMTTLAQPPIKDLFPVRLRTRENQEIAKEEPGVCKSLTSIPGLVCEVRH